MSSINDIKISELDPFPTTIVTEDFFPLVDSSSMTTYRTDISFLSGLPVSRSLFANSASFASRSISASHADRADLADSATLASNVLLSGYTGFFPTWTGAIPGVLATNGPNGNLAQYSRLYNSESVGFPNGTGIIGHGYPGSTGQAFDAREYVFDPNKYLYYTQSGWWNYKAHTPNGAGGYGVSGISVPGAIISNTFIGTDQMAYAICDQSITPFSPYTFTTQIWSGSAATGKYVTIPSGDGQLSQSLNKKWLRFASISGFGFDTSPPAHWLNNTSHSLIFTNGKSVISPSASYGERPQAASSGNGMFGRIKILVSTSGSGTNVQQMIDLNIHDEYFSGQGCTANVDYASFYSVDIIKKLRLSIWTPNSSSADYLPSGAKSADPMMTFDVYVDDISEKDKYIIFTLWSWGNVKFLKEMNVDPPLLINTGSKDSSFHPGTSPQTSTYLVFPPEPGFYTATNRLLRNYNIQGSPVTIWPTKNERTGSAAYNVQLQNPYSLNVSGTVNATDKYYANDRPGQSGKFITYAENDSTWRTVEYAGGILVDSASIVSQPLGAQGTVSVLTSSYALTASYIASSLTANSNILFANSDTNNCSTVNYRLFGWIDSNGQVRTMGYAGGSYGTMGLGWSTGTSTPTPKYITSTKSGSAKAIALTMMGLNTYVLYEDNTVCGTGYNANGQLGQGDTTTRYTLTPITASYTGPLSSLTIGPAFNNEKVVKIRNGGGDYTVHSNYTSTYYITDAGHLYMTGKYFKSGSSEGPLLNSENITIPLRLDDLIGSVLNGKFITDVCVPSADQPGVFILDSNGNVYAYGYQANSNIFGQGSSVSHEFGISNPVTVWDASPSGHNKKIVSIKGNYGNNYNPGNTVYCSMLFLTENGEVWVSGENSYGQLGVDPSISGNEPVSVLQKIPQTQFSSKKVTSIVNGGLGTKGVSAAILEDGSMRIWGSNSQGIRGIGSFDESVHYQTINPLPSVFDVKKILIGGGLYTYAMVLTYSGRVYVCGLNYNRNLGLGNIGNIITTYTEVIYPNGECGNIIDIGSFGDSFEIIADDPGAYYYLSTCIMSKNGNIYACGHNGYYQCGYGDSTVYAYQIVNK